MSLESLKQIPMKIHVPAAVFYSTQKAAGFIVLRKLQDNKGDPVIAAVHLDFKIYDVEVNLLASAYGKRSRRVLQHWLNKKDSRKCLISQRP